MTFEQMGKLVEEIRKLTPEEQGPFVTWLVVEVIRDVAYYGVVGIVVFLLGKRLIQAIMVAMRESRRERA